MNSIITKSLSDGCMCCIGLIFGVCIDFIIDTLHTYFDPTYKLRTPKIVLGILQVLINSLIIRYMETTSIDKGLFSLGLFGSQALLINTVYQPPAKFRKTS